MQQAYMMEPAANSMIRALLVLHLSQMYSANVLCNISYNPGKTAFKVPVEESEDDDCEYSWSNDTGEVLANQQEHNSELVLSQTKTSLVISGCYNVTYNLNCKKTRLKHRCDVEIEKCFTSSERHHIPAIAVGVVAVIGTICVIALCL